jgi:hypothetical protein
MKAIVKLFLILFIAVSCICCEKIEADNNSEQNSQEETNKEPEDFYYVRFDGKSQYGCGTANLSLTGCGSFSIYAGTSFSEVLGPAHKGAVAKVTTGGNCSLSIYVSKNNGPFALKRTGGNTLSYTIDF